MTNKEIKTDELYKIKYIQDNGVTLTTEVRVLFVISDKVIFSYHLPNNAFPQEMYLDKFIDSIID